MVTTETLEINDRIETPRREPKTEVLLRAYGLRKGFGGQVVLDGVSLELRRGEVVLLRGDNGSGKTTLLNILTGNLEPDAGVIELYTNGSKEQFRFPRRWWQNLNLFDHFTPERVTREGVGRTWQEVRLFPTLTLRDNIAVATPGQRMENPVRGLIPTSACRREETENLKAVEASLRELGLEGRENSSGDMVSLGQSKRVAIARAVRGGAKILFLDEPLAGLDASGIEDVMTLLKKLAQDQQVTLVIIEHVFNIPRILDLATTVWTLKDGFLTAESPHDACRHNFPHSTSGVPAWLRDLTGPDARIDETPLPGGAILATILSNDEKETETVLEVEDLVVYRGRRLVIGEQQSDGSDCGLSFKINKGENAILFAPNGWGKTTLLEAIAGIIPISRGFIRLRERRFNHQTPWSRKELGLSMVQARNYAFPRLTTRESLALARCAASTVEKLAFSDKRMSALSGGEKQMAALLAHTEPQVQIVLLDEPFSALDLKRQKEALTTFAQLKAAILIAHPSVIDGGE